MTGPELKALRITAGLTQEQAARRIGYSVRHYCRLESGKCPIAVRWADALQKKIVQLP